MPSIAKNKTLLTYCQVFLLGIGVVLAVLWVREEQHRYDAWLAASVAILALLEFLKHRIEKPELSPEQLKQMNDLFRKQLESFAQAQRQAAEQERLAKEKNIPVPVQTPKEAQVARFTRIIERRNEVESKMREYAKAKGIKDDGKKAPELLAELHLEPTWDKGVRSYLEITDNKDLPRQPEPMLEWADQEGHKFINVFEILLKNVKSAQLATNPGTGATGNEK